MTTYTMLDVLMASPDKPMPLDKRRHQLTRMYEGLAAIEKAENPTNDDWRVCSDAVNLMETLVLEMKVCEDQDGLLMDAVTALAQAGKRSLNGGKIRLDAPGIMAVRSVLSDYSQMLETLSHRTMMRCHQLTENRIREIYMGRKKAHDKEVTTL